MCKLVTTPAIRHFIRITVHFKAAVFQQLSAFLSDIQAGTINGKREQIRGGVIGRWCGWGWSSRQRDDRLCLVHFRVKRVRANDSDAQQQDKAKQPCSPVVQFKSPKPCAVFCSEPSLGDYFYLFNKGINSFSII
jgi:hypothetical protein